MVAPSILVKRKIEKMLRARHETDYLAGWVGHELAVHVKPEYAYSQSRYGEKVYVSFILNDDYSRFRIKTTFAFNDLDGKIFDIVASKKNPAHRPPTAAARRLAASFHGRVPEDSEVERVMVKPLPRAMARIGEIYAIEYVAERDGKVYKFRHVFASRSRPQLAVSPDGTQATMIGGSWFFGEDGFEDT